MAIRILVVDDDDKILFFVTELLIGAGYDVVGTSDPDRAAALARTLLPALVILDVRMPEKDGFEVAEELRSHPSLKATRILFLTAYRDPDNIRKARAVGGSSYLEKPVRSSSLLWMVKALLASGPRRDKKAQ